MADTILGDTLFHHIHRIYISKQIIKNQSNIPTWTDAGTYLGGDGGACYVMAPDYNTDYDNPIPCSWTTKALDFADQNPKALQAWKTINKITVYYDDLTADMPLTVAISNDGGLTWDIRMDTVGTGDGKSKTVDFFFRDSDQCTGQDFVINLSCTDFDGNIAWTGLLVDYTLRGSYFQI